MDTAIVGYVHVWHRERAEHTDWSMEMVIHPEHRSGDLTARLVDRTVGVCRSRGAGIILAWLAGPAPEDEGLLRRRGFVPTRDLYELRRTLPLADQASFPPAAMVRAFRPGVDDAAWLELNNSAFSDHPEQGTWTPDDLHTRMRQPWFESDGLLLLEERGGLVGSCWTKRHGHEGLGEIYVIGVHPREHGRKLGTALTLAGLDSLWRRGSAVGMLYCDADNEVAMHLYAKLGFEIHLLHRSYALDLAE